MPASFSCNWGFCGSAGTVAKSAATPRITKRLPALPNVRTVFFFIWLTGVLQFIRDLLCVNRELVKLRAQFPSIPFLRSWDYAVKDSVCSVGSSEPGVAAEIVGGAVNDGNRATGRNGRYDFAHGIGHVCGCGVGGGCGSVGVGGRGIGVGYSDAAVHGAGGAASDVALSVGVGGGGIAIGGSNRCADNGTRDRGSCDGPSATVVAAGAVGVDDDWRMVRAVIRNCSDRGMIGRAVGTAVVMVTGVSSLA